MRVISYILLALTLCFTASCGKFKTYNGPEITHVVVDKTKRRMFLLSGPEVIKAYRVGLGFSPDGHKEVEGDGRTPEGRYTIDRRNPDSQFHLSIGISYPNANDIAKARSLGKSPGGDIFIHGRPKKYRNGKRDWTAGCIAVKDREMEEIYAMVKNGTPITIRK
ncbi:L,D-transpeptidase family protein [Lentibacter algarum]|uniref:L,D-transpeptidase family protein n=1 Tax=Lentibacter algarum TaxID=576131 RepID=UPI001C072145|nr:L,D-transpeptidase family protein [Lentibacter algarum]MBU2981085.1 L,D-transpeptidase family protein [Lentibacter algarum]